MPRRKGWRQPQSPAQPAIPAIRRQGPRVGQALPTWVRTCSLGRLQEWLASGCCAWRWLCCCSRDPATRPSSLHTGVGWWREREWLWWTVGTGHRASNPSLPFSPRHSRVGSNPLGSSESRQKPVFSGTLQGLIAQSCPIQKVMRAHTRSLVMAGIRAQFLFIHCPCSL